MPYDEVLSKFKSGSLRSGSKSGPRVKNRKQAVAIMLSEKRNSASKPEYRASRARQTSRGGVSSGGGARGFSSPAPASRPAASYARPPASSSSEAVRTRAPAAKAPTPAASPQGHEFLTSPSYFWFPGNLWGYAFRGGSSGANADVHCENNRGAPECQKKGKK